MVAEGAIVITLVQVERELEIAKFLLRDSLN